MFKHKKEDKNYFLMYLISFIICGILPLAFERINLWWHTGSYQCFPWRFGFIPLFILFCGAMRYFTYYKEEKKIEFKKIFIIILLLFAIAIFLGTILIPEINENMPAFAITNNGVIIFLAISLMFCIIVVIALKIKEEEISRIILKIIIISEIMIFGLAYIGVPEGRITLEVQKMQKEILKDYSQELYRTKSITNKIHDNYAWQLNMSSIGQMTNLVTKDARQVLEYLGYDCAGIITNDKGGTFLTDSLFGVKYVLSEKELEEEFYTKIQKFENGINLYEYKYSLPIGLIIKENNINLELCEENSVFENQNILYKKLFTKEDNLLQEIEGSFKNVDDTTLKFETEIVGKQKLYLHIDSIDKEIRKLIVNGIQKYPENNSDDGYIKGDDEIEILDLGTFENEKVTVIAIIEESDYILKGGKFATLDIEKFENLINEIKNEDHLISVKGNKIKAKIDVEDENQKLFIPVNYEKAWKCTNNGEKIEISKIFGNFIIVDLQKGENNIELTYVPNYLEVGIGITVITLILLVVIYIINRKTNFTENKILINIFYILSLIILIGATYKIYIVSIIETLKNDIF